MMLNALLFLAMSLTSTGEVVGHSKAYQEIWIDEIHDFRIVIRKDRYEICRRKICEDGSIKYSKVGSKILIDFKKKHIGKMLINYSGYSKFLNHSYAGNFYGTSLVFPDILQQDAVCNGRKFIEFGEFDGERYSFCLNGITELR